MMTGLLNGMASADMEVTGSDVAKEMADEVAHCTRPDDDIIPSFADVNLYPHADISLVAAADISPVSVDDVISASADDVSHTAHDDVAHAFNNSTRKMVSYITPTIQNGEVVVRPTIDTIRNGSTRWKTTSVGYFLGKRSYFHDVKEFALSVWPGLREVTATMNDFFFFQFKTVAYMEEVIEGGPWLFQGQSIVLQKREPGMAIRKLKHTQVLVWIKLRHSPVELWIDEGLSTVASSIGKLLYPDVITRACTRLDFARVCVMLDVSSKLPKHIIIMTPDEKGGEAPCKVDVEYEWVTPKCTNCMTLGHPAKDCTLNKPSKSAKHPFQSTWLKWVHPNHVLCLTGIYLDPHQLKRWKNKERAVKLLQAQVMRRG
ncbi:UNVERIFIED_CONTAM: hypothetical protein Sindi_1836500, partial [Sesamum indicum]